VALETGEVMIGVAGSLSSGAVIFVAMAASILLLCLRAWFGTTGIILNRRVTILLDGSTVLMVALFLLLVLFRFKALA
jgi:hypothetical protein